MNVRKPVPLPNPKRDGRTPSKPSTGRPSKPPKGRKPPKIKIKPYLK